MKAVLQERTAPSFGVLAIVAIFVLSCCVAEPQAAFSAGEAATATAKSNAEQTEKSASAKSKDAKHHSTTANSQKSTSAADAKKSASDRHEASGKAEHKSDGSAEKSTEKKAKAKETKHTAEATTKKESASKGEKVRLAMLTLKDSLPETAEQAGPFSETHLDLREAINRLEKAAKDKSVSGIVLDIQNPEIGHGKVAELRGAISRFRASGKKAYAMLDSAEPADYLVACACDEIIMPETGVLVLPGVHAEAMFYKGLLAKLGIEADFIHIGQYKGAAEPLTREKFSEPVRENMTSLIDDLYDDMVSTIVKDRPLTIAQAKEVIDTGMITATRAKKLGLIDRVEYPDGLRQELAKKYEAEPLVYVKNYGKKDVDTDFSGPMGFFKLLQAMMGGESSSVDRRGKKIAVVYALGPITTGKSKSDFMGSESMGSTTIIDALRKANKDKQVAAIVLRVDSPGGSALASDLIWHETQVLNKPMVASMGDVAASGGYYISMGAKKIIAAPSTITGSIGVVGGKLAMKGLFDKIGITTETIERGKNSGLFSSSGKFTDSQREVITQMMQEMYGQFTTKAARGRHMSVENLRKLAGGRVYSGRQAKDNGLVDQLGTLHDAIVEAKKLAGLSADTDVRIEVLPEPTNFFEQLFGDMDSEKEVQLGAGLDQIAPGMMNIIHHAASLRAVFDRPVAFIMPFDLEIH
ncbi:MAG TPA: signal peptide peptidase SppA [Lacipirellulaceae bacterium]|nr:signal peptide peptidase SppA [Lacipirellulaceae bacterium]